MRTLLAVTALLVAGSLSAQPFRAGEAVVTDQNGSVYRVDAAGTVTSFVSVGTFAGGIDFDYDGNVICSGASLVRIFPIGGFSTIVSTLAASAYAVEVGPQGNYWVASLSGGATGVVEYDRTGNTVRMFQFAQRPWGIGYDSQNDSFFVTGTSAMYKLDRVSGAITTLAATGGSFYQEGHATGGIFYVGDDTLNGVLTCDRTGTVNTLWSGTPMADPEGVDAYANGDLLIADDSGAGGDSLFVVTTGSTPQLTTLAVGGIFSDLNCCAVRPDIVIARRGANPRVGQTVTLDVTSTGAAGEQYIFASSLSANNGIILPGGRLLPIDLDGLFGVTVNNSLPGIFMNYRGTLDDKGQATLSVAIPNINAFVGISFYTAGIATHPNARAGIHVYCERSAQVTVQP